MAQRLNIHNSKRRTNMKTFRKAALAVVLLVVAIVITAYAQQYPKATGYVNDFANLLTREQGVLLNDELIAFEKKTTIEIAVVTVPWLNNQSIEDYTRGLAKEWGVGKRDQNNGIVFLIAPKERKMRIETASGARSILTDSRADQIRDDAVIPRFKAGNMPQGIIDGTHAIMRTFDASSAPAIAEKEIAQARQSGPEEWTYDDKMALGGTVVMALLLLVVMFFQIVSKIKQKIAFTEEARKEGPELLKKIPDMIKAAEKKLAEGKSSPKAVEYLEQARTQYARVRSQQSGMTMTDWTILYLILTGIRSNTANAESAHQDANTDYSNDYSSRSSSPSSSNRFGDSKSGFSGGGGFDSRGGGSSGSW